MSLRNVTVKLEDSLLAEIESTARTRRVSRSQIMRERLERVEAPGNSVWDRMQDLVVGDDAEPPDLASNKARMRGYGRAGSR